MNIENTQQFKLIEILFLDISEEKHYCIYNDVIFYVCTQKF